jgi:hypothetical protein
MKAGGTCGTVQRGAAFLDFKNRGEIMKKQVKADPFNYWRSLIDYLERRGDVAFIKSITIKEGQFSHGPVNNPRKCIHEAAISYRKVGEVRVDSTLKPGHLEICTWID